ncbi:MAG: RnfABCDGE type electron transport complex subunit G [Butyricicoccus sp.]|nr:RnfABCDGE type electron transport complex subunit G [Butyricicoccus pullicaecorum]MCI6719676.1 RnfABCDGE type electron transport complex subunit G [Clostridiales bacterium]MDY5973196.1 RnfABCDGE type electron transport complex subunit G [Butyricicoccus sp.]
MSETKKNEGIGRLVVVLGLITLVCALLLGVVNQVTAPQIEQNNINTRNAAMAELIAGAEFEDMNVTEPATKEEPTGISGVYKATIDGQDAGYCVEVQPSGFGGVMTLIVGVNADGTIAGAKVTAHGETPGLGAKAQADPEWIKQFAGKAADGSLAVAKDGGDVVAITGATITSRAVTRGVNRAATYVASLG